jgi:hypothetical protein
MRDECSSLILELEQRIERQRVELAAANKENRRGNEFARKSALREVAEKLWKIELVARSDYDTDDQAFQAIKSMIFALRRECEVSGRV